MKELGTLFIVFLIGISTLTLLSTQITYANDEDSVTGKFTIGNVAPQVTVELYKSDEATTTSTVEPLVEYAVKINVYDPNTLNDIDWILVNFTYVTYNPNYPAYHALYVWNKSVGTWELSQTNWGSWSVESGSRAPGSMSSVTGDWWLHFKASKVARAGAWNISVRVYDGTNEAYNLISFTMLKYSEIDIDATWFSFGQLSLGEVNKPIQTVDGNAQNYFIVRSLANSQAQLWIGTTSTWNGTSGSLVVVSTDPVLDPGEILLKANTVNNISSSKQVTPYYNVSLGTINPPESETYVSTNIYMWISVASSGIPTEEYQGIVLLRITV